MPAIGRDKDILNFLADRIKTQIEFWPDFVEAWDENANGKRFRGESMSLTELWNLYLGYVRETSTEVEISTGKINARKEAAKNPKKGYTVIPCRAFELPGRFYFRSKHHEGANGYLEFDQWLYARDQARKDLFWFGKEVFDMDYFEHVHRVTTNQFVQKDFDGVFEEGYTTKEVKAAFNKQNRVPRVWVQKEEYTPGESLPTAATEIHDMGSWIQDPIEAEKYTNQARTMILLDPRGFFKTFTDILDTVQWVISCPDVRILMMSGTYKLTLQFLSLFKGKFFLPPGQRPTKFHLLFPEYVDRSADGDSKEPYIYPGRKLESPDPTMGIMSIGSSLSGFHCDVLKFDDIVTDDNCLTDETRQALKDKADGAVNLLMPWGWHDMIGTRYFPDDYYGISLDQNKESEEDYNLKFFTRAAWYVKEEFKDVEERSLFDLTEEMVTLTFPEHKPFKSLRKDLRKNEKSFRCQQLNQPVWGDANSISLDRLLLEQRRDKTLAEVLAAPGYVYGAIDMAKENKQFSDYTALAIGKVYQEGSTLIQPDENGILPERPDAKWVMVILDVQFGKWSQNETINRITEMNNKWRPKSWSGEDTGGLLTFKERLIDVSKLKYGHWPYIVWSTPDNSESAKKNRIKGVELLLRAARLYFMIASWNEEVFSELEKYKGQKSTRYFKDDVPDVLSMLAKRIPSMVRLSQKELDQQTAQKEAQYREQLRREMNRVIFGADTGGYSTQPSQWPSYSEPREESRSPMGEVANKFFRGNGLRA
ncbi:Uncharacterised protein [uncultured archaeon]|nr:Uncharacterised protein [uncultured archaeon]